MCVCLYRGQRTTLRSWFSLPTCGTWRWSSSCKDWRQVCLLTEPTHWQYFLYYFIIFETYWAIFFYIAKADWPWISNLSASPQVRIIDCVTMTRIQYFKRKIKSFRYYHFDKLTLWCQNAEEETINNFRSIVLGSHNKSQCSKYHFC